MSVTLMLPFSINSFGGVNTTTDINTMWKDRVTLAVMTGLGERVFRPNYGTSVISSTFESEDFLLEFIPNDVAAAFSNLLPELTLTNVEPVVDTYSGTVTVNVMYVLPNGDTDQTAFKTGVINRTGEIVQEYL